MCINIYKLYSFTKTGNVEQELPLHFFFTFQGLQVRRGDQGSFTSSLYKMDPCIFDGFLSSKQQFCLNACSCQVPHSVGASVSENQKSAPKNRVGPPDFVEKNPLARFVAGS